MEANALPGSHFVNLQPGRVYTLTRTGEDDTALNGDLDITRAMTILCPDCVLNRATVDANLLDRAFDVHVSNVTLSGFDIRRGRAIFGATVGDGGGVRVLSPAANVSIEFMTFYNNGGTQGGALYNQGSSTTVTGSEFRANGHTNPALFNLGAAIANFGSLSLRRSLIHDHSWPEEIGFSAIEANGTFTRISDTTISSNLNIHGLRVQGQQTELRNVTLVNNMTGLLVIGAQQLLLARNVIVAGNSGSNCTLPGGNTFSLDGFNMSPSVGCGFATGTSNIAAAPRLTPLVRRHGAAFPALHWPRVDSPALNAGAPVTVGDFACGVLDQNGEPRPQGFNGPVRCDVGAAEVPSDAIFFDSMEIF